MDEGDEPRSVRRRLIHDPCDVNELRRRASRVAAALVRDRDVVGLGTGRTAALVVEALAARASAESLSLRCVATSVATEMLARANGLDVRDANEVASLDIAIDGADEVDGDLDLVKGLGGALVRERLVERMAKRLVIVVDEEKLVASLGRGMIPVEIVPFGAAVTVARIEALGVAGKIRGHGTGAPFSTDNGNWIVDLELADRTRLAIPASKRAFAAALKEISGVVDHGLFLGMANEVVVGRRDGTVDTLRR